MGGLIPAASTSSSDRVRLHITPFNPELVDRYLAPSVRSVASGLSFHTVQTDPGRGFGFVELPVMEADKLKKKLNGSVLKGAKVKIEEARPEKKRKQDDLETTNDGDEKVPKKVKRDKKDKKSKLSHDVIRGHELEDGRHIKRGWEDKNEKSKSSSSKDSKEKKKKKTDSKRGIEQKEMRFKTVVPPNAAPLKSKSTTKSKSSDKDSKSSKGKKTLVVKEFERARKPAPGSSVTTGERPSGYEDGKGWVDESGAVVQAEAERTKHKRALAVPEPRDVDLARTLQRAKIEETRKADDSSSSDDLDDESSVVSSSSESESDLDDAEEDEDSQSMTSAPTANDTMLATPAAEVHPLEALFKRPAPPSIESPGRSIPAPIDTSFSFFTGSGDGDAAADDDEDDSDVPAAAASFAPPQTPHTKMDMEWRMLRSGAPTPDTQAIGKRFNFDIGTEHDDDGDDASDVIGTLPDAVDLPRDESSGPAEREGSSAAREDGAREESAFRKWFYEHRGDLNRSWKKRRRDERKAQRQRENRRVGRKVA